MTKLVRYGELTSQQLLAVDLLVMKRGTNATYAQIAEAVGVSSKTLERWRRLPEFQLELRRRSIELLSESLPLVLDTLTKKALQGNTKAIELYLKASGLLKHEIDVTARPVPVAEQSNEDIEAEIEQLQRELYEIENAGRKKKEE